eukprot:gene4019-5023_t
MDIVQFWKKEFQLITKIIELFPGHESPWNYRRTMATFYLLEMNQHLEPFITDSEDPPVTLYGEFSFCKDIISDTDSSYYEKQRSLAERYYTWILNLQRTKLSRNQSLSSFGDSTSLIKSSLSNLKSYFPNQSQLWDYKLNNL